MVAETSAAPYFMPQIFYANPLFHFYVTLVTSEALSNTMKSHIFFAVLLKGIAASPEQDLAPREAETYCVTYLSTYLAAIPTNDGTVSSINGDTNGPDEEDRETGRFPLAPSIRPTFGRNNSIATTSPNSISSLIDEETSQLAEFVPGSTSGDEPLSSDEPPTTQSVIQTSFGQTTLAAPTTTSIIEPEGQTVIFLIRLPDDDRKRSINKREVGGFGDGSPDTCTFASTFNLAQGQLFKIGNPIFYSGEDFKQLEGQGVPSSDAVTKGFASTGTSLSFQNDDLPNGEAGFCQTSNGRVYITFTSAPPGCTPVALGVYDESIIVSEEATSLSSEAVEPSTSSFGLTTLQPDLTSSNETPSSIEEVAPTTSLKVDDSTSDTSVLSTSGSSLSELAESSTVSDNTFITLATFEVSPVETTTESVGDTAQETTSTEATTKSSTTADETTVQTTTTPETPTTTVNACVAGITSAGGSPPLQDRIDNCEEFNVVTVSLSTVQLVRRQDPEATAIFPSKTPAYATYCDSAEEYYKACLFVVLS
ncbi:hypothetical protein FPRO06_10885 [Fusarium proliferatum]|nr:hypothetical protein FPRO06_10885 [Fusarium proliferatum]